MTVMRAWALLFWAGAVLGWVGHMVAVLGPSEAGTVRTIGLLVMAASALPVIAGFVNRLLARLRAARSLPDEGGDPLVDTLRPSVASARVHGIAAAIADRPGEGRERFLGSSGTARELDPKTGFEIGSLSKTFTAILLAEMVGRGEVALDDPLAQHLPAAAETAAGERVTLVDLATHTAGLPRLPARMLLDAILQSPDPYRRYDTEALEQTARRLRTRGEVGSRFNYSNLGFALLGRALELAAKRPYAELISERICAPLGLAETAVGTIDGFGDRAARCHDQFDLPVPGWDLAAIAPAGGIRSTLTDMRRYLGAQLAPSETPLADAIALAHEPRRPTRAGLRGRLLGSKLSQSRIGLAWITSPLDSAGGATATWHNGGTGGFGTFLGFDSERGRGVVLLSNSVHSGRLDQAGFELLSTSTRVL